MSKSTGREKYPCWVHIFPSENIPGEWIAHALDLDIVTQGRSREHAIEMIREAVQMVLDHHLEQGTVFVARKAPEEDWEPLWPLIQHGVKLESEKDAAPSSDIAVYFVFAATEPGVARPFPLLARLAA